MKPPIIFLLKITFDKTSLSSFGWATSVSEKNSDLKNPWLKSSKKKSRKKSVNFLILYIYIVEEWTCI